jgi:hypothetical protein
MSDERSRALANELRRRGLDAPAIVLLHAHRPLRPLLGHLAAFLSPLARPLGGLVGRAGDALRDDAAYDELIADLEAPEER